MKASEGPSEASLGVCGDTRQVCPIYFQLQAAFDVILPSKLYHRGDVRPSSLQIALSRPTYGQGSICAEV
jgi:hypothetical protein